MRRAALALFAVLGISGFFAFRSVRASQPPVPDLGVLRTAPDGLADPGDPITVTFDRPVAGGLEEMVDPREVFRITPRVEGKAEWRDPVTLRFTPAAPLPPGAVYRVSIANTFTAMDGSRLPRPHRFTVRVSRARVLAGFPVGSSEMARFLPPSPRFRVLLSSQAEPRDLLANTTVELDTACGGGVVPLRLVGQHPIGTNDPDWFRYYGATGNDSTRDPRRVAELTPTRPLPRGCGAALVVPARLDSLSGTGHAVGLRHLRAAARAARGVPRGGRLPLRPGRDRLLHPGTRHGGDAPGAAGARPRLHRARHRRIRRPLGAGGAPHAAPRRTPSRWTRSSPTSSASGSARRRWRGSPRPASRRRWCTRTGG